ncbi:MAG: hypothetical protein HY048_13720 [Acidobacteria bacterium]|nr:hypothetical protein [Acidobacteriota bacterium]
MRPLTDALSVGGLGAVSARIARALPPPVDGAAQPGVVRQLHVILAGGADAVVAAIANVLRDASIGDDGAAGLVRPQAAAAITATPATIPRAMVIAR